MASKRNKNSKKKLHKEKDFEFAIFVFFFSFFPKCWCSFIYLSFVFGIYSALILFLFSIFHSRSLSLSLTFLKTNSSDLSPYSWWDNQQLVTYFPSFLWPFLEWYLMPLTFLYRFLHPGTGHANGFSFDAVLPAVPECL